MEKFLNLVLLNRQNRDTVYEGRKTEWVRLNSIKNSKRIHNYRYSRTLKKS